MLWGMEKYIKPYNGMFIFIDRIALVKQGDNRIGSVRPSVHPSVRQSTLSRLNRLTFDLDNCQVITLKFETKMKRAEKSDFQSEVFVCVSTNRADAVDRLLICICYRLQSISKEVR